uniref:Reverse transcriptase Ty1/copia-type domain-containing protein n=1 Tax=Solanum lycopersicum TaxID=4081 RepID=A0A3Q7G3U9_SOLLC
MFRQLVGSLNYLTITRPNIFFCISQFMQALRHLHLVAVRCIIWYLRGTSTRGLFFPSGSPIRLNAFSDSDWAGCPDTRCLVTGWCMFLGELLISWKSKKQDCVSKSSAEVEYRSMSTACSEVVWLRGLLAEIGFPQSHPTPLHAPNLPNFEIGRELFKVCYMEMTPQRVRLKFSVTVKTKVHYMVSNSLEFSVTAKTKVVRNTK